MSTKKWKVGVNTGYRCGFLLAHGRVGCIGVGSCSEPGAKPDLDKGRGQAILHSMSFDSKRGTNSGMRYATLSEFGYIYMTCIYYIV